MKKRGRMHTALFVLFVLFAVSCTTTSTKVLSTWKESSYTGKAQKIAVIMIAKNLETRHLFEGAFTAALEERGNNALASHKIIPADELNDKNTVAAKIKAAGADTIIVSRLIERAEVEATISGYTYTVPTDYTMFGLYWGVLSAAPSSSFDTQLLSIETNVYDVTTEKLIWSARSKTEVTEGEQQLIRTFVKLMTDRLSSDRIIK